MKRLLYLCLFSCVLFLVAATAMAQTSQRVAADRCATMPRLEQRLQRDPQLRTRFNNQQREFLRYVSQQTARAGNPLRTEATITIPVVFHILMPNPSQVTDAQIQAQLDTLNRSFFGSNGDSVRIPTYFKTFFGKSTIQFCLAQRTPDGEETTGIIRKSTTQSQFSVNDAMKYTALGGTDSWNTENYFNIWVCPMSGGVLGYATLPNDGAPKEQGVVIDYRSLPGGSISSYNGGKTLIHEAGHYFNLYHIWGDDNGLCSGSDQVDDTPNQGNSTTGCHTGVRTDNCTSTGDGIMYQNYMDYSYDQCLVMFTPGQVARMENTIALYRPSLLRSNACQPIVRKAFDAQLRAVVSPAQRLCSPALTPVVTIRNRGTQALTSVIVRAQVDNGAVTSTNWTGNLSLNATANVTLSNLTVPAGEHILTVYTTSPNGRDDEDKANDTLRFAFQYFEPVNGVTEGFETTKFSPAAWDIVNPDGSITWERKPGVSKSGTASVMINNFEYKMTGQKDDLRLPQVSIPSIVDSAFFSFEVAAAVYSDLNTANNIWDTLEVLVSADCGQTYTSLYKKWGSSLVTRQLPITDPFVPVSAEWRKDSINLAGFIGKSNLMFLFRNTTGFENNIYLDDVSLRTVTINPNLKSAGFLVTPNPSRGQVAVQFYPQPTNLKGIQVFSAAGQKVFEQTISGSQASNLYTIDLSRYPAGVYTVRAVFADRVVIQKLLKM